MRARLATHCNALFDRLTVGIRWCVRVICVRRDLWSIVHELSEEDKKKFLFFCTGSDRVPIKGLGNLEFVIGRCADSDRLPSAHTCFNHLLLPDYSSREKLKKYLITALANNKGFGLM